MEEEEDEDDLRMISMDEDEDERPFSKLMVPILKNCGKVPVMAGYFSNEGKMYAYGNLLHKAYVSPLFEFLWMQFLAHAQMNVLHPHEEFLRVLKEEVIFKSAFHHPYRSLKTMELPVELIPHLNELKTTMYIQRKPCEMWFLCIDCCKGFYLLGHVANEDDSHHVCTTIPFYHFLFKELTLRPKRGVPVFDLKRIRGNLIMLESEKMENLLLDWLPQEEEDKAVVRESADTLKLLNAFDKALEEHQNNNKMMEEEEDDDVNLIENE